MLVSFAGMAARGLKRSLCLPIGDRRKWDYAMNEIAGADPFVPSVEIIPEIAEVKGGERFR